VDAVDDIRSNGGLEDSGERKHVARWRRAAGGKYVDLRTGRLQQNVVSMLNFVQGKEKKVS
jgi:hypothetical protein